MAVGGDWPVSDLKDTEISVSGLLQLPVQNRSVLSNEQHIPVHIHIPCGLRYCDTALPNPPYRIKLELAAELPSLECGSAKGKHPVLVSTNPAAGHSKSHAHRPFDKVGLSQHGQSGFR